MQFFQCFFFQWRWWLLIVNNTSGNLDFNQKQWYHVIHVFDITFWCKIIIFVVGEWLLVDFGNVLFCNFVHCSLSLVDSVVTCNHFFLLLKLWFILVKWCWFLIKLFWYVTELQWNGFSSFNDIFKFLPVLVSSLAQKLGRRKCEPPVYGLSGHNPRPS